MYIPFRALGLFGFSGGITNWLAVKMLFDRVPYLAGSGVITKQFKEIRQTVMDTVLETFFDAAFLGKYIADKAVQMENSDFLRSRIAKILDSAEVDEYCTTMPSQSDPLCSAFAPNKCAWHDCELLPWCALTCSVCIPISACACAACQRLFCLCF